MQPNSQEVLFDNSKDTFYFIQTDASGIKAIKECNYTIVEPETPEDFVKRNEFEQIKSQIGRIEDIHELEKTFPNPPEEMMDAWIKSHNKFIEKTAWIKQILAM